MALGLFLLRLLDLEGFWIDVLLALTVTYATYTWMHRHTADRLARAQKTLRDIRKQRFDELEKAYVRPGDELNTLLWQVYRNGQVLEKEIELFRRTETYRRDFIGNVSHELKTPIFSVRGYAETLLDGALHDPEVSRPFVEKILRNADRLHNLAADLSELSKIETGELKMSRQLFDLPQLITETTELLEAAAEKKEVSIRVRIPSNITTAFGDPERLKQVFVNLIDNGIKYNNAGGHVEVVARMLPDHRIKVTVADNGIGIPSHHLNRVTERFYRVDKSRSRSQGGTGLGLAIVKHILAAHEAQLVIDSQVQRGSTFGFTLPSRVPDAAH